MIGDGAFLEAEGPRQADVVFAQHFEHRGAHHARQIADPAEANREGRKYQVIELVEGGTGVACPDRREPAQSHREQQEAIDGDHEGWQRDGTHRQHADDAVGEGSPIDRGETAERYAEQRRPADAGGDQG